MAEGDIDSPVTHLAPSTLSRGSNLRGGIRLNGRLKSIGDFNCRLVYPRGQFWLFVTVAVTVSL